MSLDAEQIKALLTKPERKPRQKRGIDTSVRDRATWFKLSPKIIDEDANFMEYKCENPNCLDTRPGIVTSTGEVVKKHFTVEISGVRVCRRCFLAGYLLDNPEQERLAV